MEREKKKHKTSNFQSLVFCAKWRIQQIIAGLELVPRLGTNLSLSATDL